MLEDPKYLGPIIYTDESPTYYEQEITFDGTPGGCVTYTNTAWVELTGTNPSDTADVTVCDMTDLEVEKSVTALYDRDYDWTVSKTVDQTEFEIADDGTVTASYTVIADAGEPIDTNKRVAGTITVTNPNTSTGPVMATVEDVSTIGGSQCTIRGDDADDLAGFQVILEDGEAAVLDYECIIPAGTDIDADYLNTVTVTWGEDGSAAADAEIAFAIDELTDDEVTITDVMEGRDPEVRDLGTASAGESPKEFTYSEELVGTAGICTDYTNTAIVSEETQDDEGNFSSVSVTVCAEADLTVVKTAEGSFTRDYNWAVEKDADETEFYVGEDGTATAAYSVTAAVEGYVDEDWALSGSITVANPNEYKDMTVSVTDTSGMPGVCVLDDGVSTVGVPAGETTTVNYDCTFAEGVAEEDYSGLENLVEITWTAPDGEERSSSGTAPIEFVQAGSIDNTVTVFDDKTVEGEEVELGTVTVEEGTRTFVYDHVLEGTAGSCTVFTNTAIVPEESRQDDNNTASADVTVCTDAPITVDTAFDANFDRDYQWNLAKSVDQESPTVLPGELAEFLYTVTATPLGFTDSGHELVGMTTITNPNTFKDQLVTVGHTEDFGGLTCTVVGDDVNAEMPGHQVLVPRQDDSVPGQATVEYACEGAPDNYSGSITATVDYVDSSEADRSVRSASNGMYEVDEETNKSIIVFDDMTNPEGEPTELGTAHWSEAGTPTEFTYSVELGNPGTQCLSYTNRAFYEGDEREEVRILGDGVSSAFILTDDQLADGSIMLLQQTRASVEVEVCVEHPLTVQIEAEADYDRTYLWDIDKSVDRSEVTLDGAGSVEFHYVVAVAPKGYVDSDHSLSGSLTIANPNDHVEPVVTVEPSVSFEGLTCEIITADHDPDMPGVQVLVPAMNDGVEGAAVVEFDCSGEPDTYTGSVTASVAYQDANENDTVVTASNDVAYDIDEETNKTITVLDDKTDPSSDPVILGTADWNEEGIAAEFDYTLRFDAVLGQTVTHINTAWIAETEQSDTETVKITADEPIVPITPPVQPVPPAKPTPKPLPPTGIEGSGWLLVLGGSVLLLGGGLVFGTNRRRQTDQ